ncbi:MAG: prolyl oligopeptidase family serine peptidase [Opitutaceae bacterium]
MSQPPDFDDHPQRRWPLILFLHGAGERGSQLTDITRQGLPKLLSTDSELFPDEIEVGRDVGARFVVVAPQCSHYEVWNDDEVLCLLEDVRGQFNVDPARVYFTGMSMGGFGVWSIGLRHLRRFAALVPVCGGGRITDVSAAAEMDPVALRSLGVWAFHGARDRVVPVEESERMIEALRGAGVPDVKFTVYPECEHDSWSASYANPELYQWLLQHAR